MVTAASSAMREVVAQVQPVLKKAGFRKRTHTFNRTVEPGLVQVIEYQMGPYDPPGLVAIPGQRENLHGLFSLHLGILSRKPGAWTSAGSVPPAHPR